MKLRELKQLLATEPSDNDDLEIGVWLPGSTITLMNWGTLVRKGDMLLIEGNITPDSVLAKIVMGEVT